MGFVLSEALSEHVVLIKSPSVHEINEAITNASPEAPAVVRVRTAGSPSQSETVAAVLDDMEALARGLFPAWLPGAEGIATSTGAATAAVRSLALRHAAGTAQYGPFLADLAAGAVAGRDGHTRRHQPEVRAYGLGRVLATGFGRQTCALVLSPPENLNERSASTLRWAAQWLIYHGRFAVWICTAVPCTASRPAAAVPPKASPSVEATSTTAEPPLLAVPSVPAVPGPAAERPRRTSKARGVPSRAVPGKPHPASQAEVLLERALADRPWAAGRYWNCTVRLGALTNPVRVDLLWAKERCIVEVDGEDHRTAGKFAADRQRDVMLQIHGYVVLRFTNVQVFEDVENVLALLQQFLASRRGARKGR